MYGTVLGPTDGGDGAAATGAHALDLAEPPGATVHVLYVVDTRMNRTGMDHDEVVATVEESGDVPTRSVLERAEAGGVPAVEAIRLGVPHEVIREYARVDPVAMGRYGRRGLDHALPGSVAERVVRSAGLPVLTVQMED